MTPCARCHERNATRGDLCKRCAGAERRAAEQAARRARVLPSVIPCQVCGTPIRFLVRYTPGPREAVDADTDRDHWHPMEERPPANPDAPWRRLNSA